MERQKTRHEQAEEQLEMNPFTNEDFQRISQELLNDDANAHRVIRDTRDEIRERYKLLFIKNPEKAENLELRHLTKVAKSAFSAVIYGDVLHVTRDILGSEGSFLPLIAGVASSFNDDSQPVVTNNRYFRKQTRYNQSVGHYLNSANLFARSVAQDSIDTLKNDSSHPHYNVGQLANDLDWESYRASFRHLDNASERDDLFTCWPHATVGDNIRVSLDLMLNLWLSTSRHAKRPLNKAEFIPLYLRHIDVLSRASTIKSELHMKLHTPLKTGFFHYENMQIPINEIFPEANTIFKPTDSSDRFTYAHPSLTSNPWPQARMCPATTELTLPDTDKAQAADDFFNYFSDRFGIDVPRSIYSSESTNSEYSRTNALLLMTLLFAEHTVLNNLPTQPQAFPVIHGTF